MIPTNSNKGQGCSPVSSNCVIWQGRDIECINLCNGDSVTDVVFKMATELCSILDTLDLKTYDISCFSPICPDPQNFHDLIQFLITKICELQCCCDGTKPSQSDCPDACIVTVCPEFYYVNQLGDTITTMTLKEYVTAIGNKLCTLIPQIDTLKNQQSKTTRNVAQIFTSIIGLEEQVAQAVITLPATCLYPDNTPATTGINIIANELCNLESSTGSPIALLQSIQQQCTNMDSLKTLANRQLTYSGINGWITQTNYSTVADSINNLWLTICDMRAAVENILLTCCCTDCDDVNISFSATMSGDPSTLLTLFFTGSIPTGLTDCFPSGNLITVTDANGGSYTTYVQVVNNLNGSVVINLAGTPVNTATTLTIVIQGCWKRPAPGSDCGGLECSRMLTYVINQSVNCPTLALIPTTTTINYSFTNNVAGPITYTVELYTSPGNVFVGSFVTPNPVQFAIVTNTFIGLTDTTNYYILVKVTVAGVTTICPQAFITTLTPPCLAPTSVSATNIIV